MRVSLSLAAALTLALGSVPAVTDAHDTAASPVVRSEPPAAPMSESARHDYARLPISFVPNRGQADPRIRFQALGAGYGFAFGDRSAAVAFRGGGRAVTLELTFVGAPGVEPIGERASTGTVNYFIGDDPAAWRTALPTYEALRYAEMWPGVDLVFQGAPGRLKYELVVAPGARVDAIRLTYSGASLSLAPNGALLISTAAGALRDEAPDSYQMVDGRRVAVESQFALVDASTYGFAIGAYDAERALVIDPGLVYSTFLGGVNGDVGLGIAVDAAGNAYVTGTTPSANFPVGPGFDTSFNSGQDVFVTKLNPSGTGLVYSTFIGGSSNDQGFAIAVDSLGSAYVTGSTGSTNYPLQSGLPPFIYQPFYGGGSTDAFVTKLSPSGTALVFSTFAGGTGADQGFGIAVHSSTDVYVTGDTTSSSFARGFTTNALQKTLRGSMDAFFLRLDRFAAAAGYMSYLGGAGADSARAIAVDGARNVYLTGGTSSSDYPTTGGSFDTSYGGTEDVFVTKLRYDGSTSGPGDTYALGYSTFLGGAALDRGLGIALDSGGNAYATGITASSGGTPFPTTPGALQTTFQGGSFDAFVTKVNASGTAPLVYSTYLGGSGDDRGQGIAVDAAGIATLTGRTASASFPTTPGAFDTTWNLGDDAFVTKLGAGGSLVYSTFLGGSSGAGGNNDRGQAIALDSGGAAYVTGLANASDFPTTPGAYDTMINGGSDAFVTKIITVGAPSTLTLAPASDTNEVGNPHTVTATVTDFASQPVSGVTVRFTVTGANPTSGSAVTNTSGQATFTYTGTVAGLDTISAFADTNTNGTRDTGEPGGTATKTWTPGPPATLTLTPATATNVVGFPHCVTATVQDVYGNPVPGVTVIFSMTNAGTTNASPAGASVVTNASGQAQFCFTATLPGANTIHAFADTNGNGTEDMTTVPSEPSADAVKVWILPVSACGVNVTVGGWIVAVNGDRATFGGSARVVAGTAVGQQEYQDHGPAGARNVKSVELLALICDPTAGAATIFGTATVDGSGSTLFRIDLVDMGAPGTNDSYGITMSDGYASGQQTLQGGNVNIH